jgi:hypothetical protein
VGGKNREGVSLFLSARMAELLSLDEILLEQNIPLSAATYSEIQDSFQKRSKGGLMLPRETAEVWFMEVAKPFFEAQHRKEAALRQASAAKRAKPETTNHQAMADEIQKMKEEIGKLTSAHAAKFAENETVVNGLRKATETLGKTTETLATSFKDVDIRVNQFSGRIEHVGDAVGALKARSTALDATIDALSKKPCPMATKLAARITALERIPALDFETRITLLEKPPAVPTCAMCTLPIDNGPECFCKLCNAEFHIDCCSAQYSMFAKLGQMLRCPSCKEPARVVFNRVYHLEKDLDAATLDYMAATHSDEICEVMIKESPGNPFVVVADARMLIYAALFYDYMELPPSPVPLFVGKVNIMHNGKPQPLIIRGWEGVSSTVILATHMPTGERWDAISPICKTVFNPMLHDHDFKTQFADQVGEWNKVIKRTGLAIRLGDDKMPVVCEKKEWKKIA